MEIPELRLNRIAKEIDTLLREYGSPIHDDMGWTGEFKISTKDVVDMFLNERERVLALFGVSGSSPKDIIMHYDSLIKEKLPITFKELRDHGTHADFCDKINDVRTEAILNYR